MPGMKYFACANHFEEGGGGGGTAIHRNPPTAPCGFFSLAESPPSDIASLVFRPAAAAVGRHCPPHPTEGEEAEEAHAVVSFEAGLRQVRSVFFMCKGFIRETDRNEPHPLLLVALLFVL
jgi:hypothetical protein